MTYICVKGHASDDSDYCSVCGFKMQGTQSSVQSTSSGASSVVDVLGQLNVGKTQDNCPSCGIPHKNGLKFCEMCGYNFESKVPSSQIVVNPALDKLIALTADIPVLPIADNPVVSPLDNVMHPDFKVVITADSSIYIEDADNPFPQNTQERIFHLDLEENLVGRTNRNKNINPEIPLNDAGVSHRHMKFIKSSGGVWQALELGSSNGTKINGTELETGVPVNIKADDSFTLGMWTRITVKNR